jgi:hypothetical protein
MYVKKCTECRKAFNASKPNTLVCSDKCRKERYLKVYGRGVLVNPDLSTVNVGAMSELLVSADLLRRGYDVFRALSQGCYCDLIAVKKNSTLHIEVRTGYTSSTTGKMVFPKKKRGTIDIFAICDRNSLDIHYLSLDLKPVDI